MEIKKIEFENKELRKLLDKKSLIVDEGRKLSKEIEKLEKERNRDALKLQKIKDRVIPILQKEIAPQLGEFEDIQSIDKKDDKSDVLVAVIFDRVEQYKEAIRQQKLEQEQAKAEKEAEEKTA